jgi:hypothetical protein
MRWVDRRRKVRCNEQRPRCSHCERLNLDCTWNRTTNQRPSSALRHEPDIIQTQSTPFVEFSPGPFHGFFDSSSGSTWDEAMLMTPNSWTDYAPLPNELLPQSMGGSWHPPTLVTSQRPGSTPSTNQIAGGDQSAVADASPLSTDSEHDYLMTAFLQMLMPPILAPVEIGPKWESTRSFFASMSAESSIVRLAIMAFSAFQMQRYNADKQFDYRSLYINAATELHTVLSSSTPAGTAQKGLKHVLAALFLLTYTDVSTPRSHRTC